jgi:hypothetical protein
LGSFFTVKKKTSHHNWIQGQKFWFLELIDTLIDLTTLVLISTGLRAAPLVLSMWPCKRKLDEEKLKHASLAQQNGFAVPVLVLWVGLEINK